VPRAASAQLREGSLPACIGPDHLADLNTALNWLFRELHDAAKQHQSGGNGGRAGATRAVEAVTEFLMLFRTVQKNRSQVPLALLRDALKSLDDGLVEPMLKRVPRLRGGRAPASEGRQCLQGITVGTVHWLQVIGNDRATACKMVAAKLAERGVKPGRGSGRTTARTVREWCDAVNADVGGRGLARQTFDGMIAVKLRLPRNKVLAEQELLCRLARVADDTRAHETT
jgi:hypothetical protein